MLRNEYLDLRRRFEPASVKLVIVAESPPASGKYFYNPEGKASEPLFAALMKQLAIETETKANGLKEFQQRGWVLVDATYNQVDKHGAVDRARVILGDYTLLCEDIKQLLGAHWEEVPLVLIKKNVCQLLEPQLKKTGFNILNKGRAIFFPSSGQQGKFHRQFSEIVAEELRGVMAK